MKLTVKPEESGLRMVEYLRKKQLPKKIWHQILQDQPTLADGTPLKPHTQLQAGQIIDLSKYLPQKSLLFSKENTPMIQYEDENILVINKPAGILTHPASGKLDELTLNDFVLNHFRKTELLIAPHPVTRLDRHTSGLVIYAKKPSIQGWLQQHPPKKIYLAVVHGNFPHTQLSLFQPIRRKEGSIIEREIHSTGQFAQTTVKYLAPSPFSSLVECQLLTGRTHQIRVHLSSFGFPIRGDSLYGPPDPDFPHYGLHCYQLTIPKPDQSPDLVLKSLPPTYITAQFPQYMF